MTNSLLPPADADEALLRAALVAVVEQVGVLRTLAAHYAAYAQEKDVDPFRWAGFRGQAMAYELAASGLVRQWWRCIDVVERVGVRVRLVLKSGARSEQNHE